MLSPLSAPGVAVQTLPLSPISANSFVCRFPVRFRSNSFIYRFYAFRPGWQGLHLPPAWVKSTQCSDAFISIYNLPLVLSGGFMTISGDRRLLLIFVAVFAGASWG